MKSRFARKLTSYAREHKNAKIPVLFVLVVYLMFYNIGQFLGTNKKKLIVALSVCLIFLGTVSFAPLSVSATSENSDEAGVYYYTDDGVVEVDELEYSPEDSAVSADDIEQALKDKNGDSEKNQASSTVADKNALIYDEEKGMVRADYDDDWSLILINKKNRLPRNYDFELATIKGAIKSDVRVMPYVLEMIRAAEDDGVKIKICSPYRDLEKQEELFQKKIKSYLRKDYEFQEAYELASQTVAIPGTSEHQAGLAFDFISDDYTVLEAGFADTEAGKWLKENAADYGFILRYPEGKEAITEIEFEPWHYRYVGEKAAHEIMDRGLCLEEYVSEIGLTD